MRAGVVATGVAALVAGAALFGISESAHHNCGLFGAYDSQSRSRCEKATLVWAGGITAGVGGGAILVIGVALPEERPKWAKAPGWYPDPKDANRLRWWDGSRWTTWIWVPDPPSTSPAHDPSDSE